MKTAVSMMQFLIIQRRLDDTATAGSSALSFSGAYRVRAYHQLAHSVLASTMSWSSASFPQASVGRSRRNSTMLLILFCM